MTRIFDALRKARSAHPVHGPAAPQPHPAIAVVPPGPASSIRTAVERPLMRGDGGGHLVVPFTDAAELTAEVEREMTGLRVSLEAILTQRVPRTVLFLAAQGGEGTTTVTAQFAQTLARDRRSRVLLLDAHARRPAYGRGGEPTERHPKPAARSHPAQPAPPGPDLMPLTEQARAEGQVTPVSLRAAIDAVASAYDWILVDGPPVLESPDAATLGAVTDGVVVVVQAGRTKRPVLSRAVDLVNRSGGNVLGIVLNRRRLEIPEFIYRRI